MASTINGLSNGTNISIGLIEGDSGDNEFNGTDRPGTTLTLTGSGGNDTFIIPKVLSVPHSSSQVATNVITDFTGVGRGTNSSRSFLDEIDLLKFEGRGLTARNMLLQQRGADLLITFYPDLGTQVILKNFQLENLDNLPSGIGNVLFDGQSVVQDDFDLFSAIDNPKQVFNRNTVTFLNTRNNTTSGFKRSHDTINGQEGDDKLSGLSGHDLLRGEGGNDTLLGGEGPR